MVPQRTNRLMFFPLLLLLSAIFAIALARPVPVAETHDGGCTLSLVRADRTTDGRMLIWKNRDVTDSNQVARIFQGPTYRFVGIGYGDDTTQVWGGANNAGFAVANSNAVTAPC